jgi:hypothetical protein
MPHHRPLIALVTLAAVALLAGCGSGSGSSNSTAGPTILPGRVFGLSGFKPAGPVRAGRPTVVSFKIRTPSGKPLTEYRQCCAPHVGVFLLVIRSDDSHLTFDAVMPAANGEVREPVVFPTPGRYRITIDAWPKVTNPNMPFNFQLFKWVTVRGRYHPQPLPPYRSTEVVDGYRFTIQGHPHLKAIQPNFLVIHATDPDGHKAVFGTWRGALAHAIFFRQGNLAYSHTHVCKPGAIYCFSVLGNIHVTGDSTTPGVLRVGVLLPEAGTWRLFLLTYLHDHVVTVPLTLHVS